MMPQDTEVDIIKIDPNAHYILKVSSPDMQAIQANKGKVEQKLNDWLKSDDRFLTLAVTSDTTLELERVEEEASVASEVEPATVEVDAFGHPIG